MSERSEMIEWIRGEMVGPSRLLSEPAETAFHGRDFIDLVPLRRGQLVWRPAPEADPEEVLYFDRESPHRKYGAGLLHPTGMASMTVTAAPDAAMQATDTIGVDIDPDDDVDNNADNAIDDGSTAGGDSDLTDDFEVTSPDIRHPSTIGISFCVRLADNGQLVVRLPSSHRFPWQARDSTPFSLNGRYESCTRRWTDDNGAEKESPMWRRLPALAPDTNVVIHQAELQHGQTVHKPVTMPDGSPISLSVDLFPRRLAEDGLWLVTVVLRNNTQHFANNNSREATLYQTHFEVEAVSGSIERYPESQRPFEELDDEEKSLALLYRESATWGIGHGCAAGWDAGPGERPFAVYADVMPAVQLPSMTPDIKDADGNPIQLSMRLLADLPDDGQGPAWDSLGNLSSEYAAWIQRSREQLNGLGERFGPVASRHLNACDSCLSRINTGINLLRDDARVRKAFRFANLAMLLQQIATKQLDRRPLHWDQNLQMVSPSGISQSPWDIYANRGESVRLGNWRAFQIAFLLMSLDGVRRGASPDREIVDLIWFPTGGGKTEAYLAVMAFYMFHERFLIGNGDTEPQRDGTNVLMRYTLRMLTTQQFQRAASLICAMEFLRRKPALHNMGDIPGRRLSLGLWVGRDGSPNKIERDADTKLAKFRSGDGKGNPLVLTECPWCRSEIGRYDGTRPRGFTQARWNSARTRGITAEAGEGPLLHCTDPSCCFGDQFSQTWLPVEVIDERIYRHPPSMVIATADKLAIAAYRPEAGSLFGRRIVNGQALQESYPPGLIIQDELHLISGPLGTMYALYEGVFERLCSFQSDGNWIKPKLIASTATIRGAAEQVLSLYARPRTSLFPCPGLMMGDSFFGKYARNEDGALLDGRLYLGIHAGDYGSVLTAQVRTFSSALFRPYSFATEGRDPWWTMLAFYNSIRELGGAKTLFDSDIRSRLKYMFNRENFDYNQRRNIRIVEELTSRLSQSEIVGMMDRLSAEYSQNDNRALDACLASNIIEVGVDIDRLSLMGVVGQPKTTATYIQVTGRVGRKWWERAGLILMIYNPSKSRDRSHFEQFHSYHRRLYERVEPTSATPFALSAIQRALPGALLTWARMQSDAPVQNIETYENPINDAFQLLLDRCQLVQTPEDRDRSVQEMERVLAELEYKWELNPQEWEHFPPAVTGEYLMLWPGQYATLAQKQRGLMVPSSMRQVDSNAELNIDQGYVPAQAQPAVQGANPPANP